MKVDSITGFLFLIGLTILFYIYFKVCIGIGFLLLSQNRIYLFIHLYLKEMYIWH